MKTLQQVKQDVFHMRIGENYVYDTRRAGQPMEPEQAQINTYMISMFDAGKLIPLKRLVDRNKFDISEFEHIAQKSENY